MGIELVKIEVRIRDDNSSDDFAGSYAKAYEKAKRWELEEETAREEERRRKCKLG